MSTQPTPSPDSLREADLIQATTLDLHELTPPANLYVRVDDKLIIDYFSAGSNATVTIAYRLMNTKGRIIEFQYAFIMVNNGSLNTINIPLSEGYLLGVTVGSPQVGTFYRGQAFFSASIGRLIAPSTFLRCQTLFADYLTGTSALGWPGGAISQSTSGSGYVNVISLAAPGAGLEVSTVVQANQTARVKALSITLTTSAAVANRQIGITWEDNTTRIFYSFQTLITQAAGLTQKYRFVPGIQAPVVGGTEVLLPLPPDMPLPINARLRTVSVALQAADQYSNIFLFCESWMTG